MARKPRRRPGFRIFALAPLIALLLAAPDPGRAAAIGDDGLHKQDWFAVTFRDIAEDIEEAARENKRLVLLVEQRGCIYCRNMHEKLLADPEIRDYLKDNYAIVQYNLYGDEEVVDLDGEVLTEKTAAQKWGVIFTPTLLFMPESADADRPAHAAAPVIMPGVFHKGTFLDMFVWVREKGYEGEENFQRYHARRIRERTAAGIPNTD